MDISVDIAEIDREVFAGEIIAIIRRKDDIDETWTRCGGFRNYRTNFYTSIMVIGIIKLLIANIFRLPLRNNKLLSRPPLFCYYIPNGGDVMETREIILELRTQKGLSQEELAEKVMVTRQAVSRWENGETIPNTETLKLLSKEFDVSINTLLGAPRQLIYQCCGMPLQDDAIIRRDSDGSLNEDYCKWCYADGNYTYSDMDDLIDVCAKNMVNENFTEEQVRAYMKEMLPKLDYWKRYDELSDNGQFEEFKKQLITEINELHIEGMPKVEKLNALVGRDINLEYPLPNGMRVKFLDNQKTYLGNQLECEFGGERYFGVLASMDFVMVCTYDADLTNPELILYKKR